MSFYVFWFKFIFFISKVFFEVVVVLERNGIWGGWFFGWELFLLKLLVFYKIEYNIELEEIIVGCK